MAGKIINKPNCTVFVPVFETQNTTDISVLVFYPGNSENTKEGRAYFEEPLIESLKLLKEKYIIVIVNQQSSKWETVKKEYTEAMASVPQGDGKDVNNVLKEKTISISVFASSGLGTTDIQTNLISINPLHLLIMNTASGTLIQNVKTLISKGTSCYLIYDYAAFNSMPDMKPMIASLKNAVDAGVNKSVSGTQKTIIEQSIKIFGPEMEKTLVTPTQKKQDQPVPTNVDKPIESKVAEDANQPVVKSETSSKWNITIDGLGDSYGGGSASVPYEIMGKKDLPGFIIYVGNPETDWAQFGEKVPAGGDDFQNVGDGEELDEEYSEQGFAGDEEEIAYQLGSIYGDSEGSEDETSGSSGTEPSPVAGGSLPPSGNAGGAGEKRFQKSMMVNGIKVLNGELPKNLVKKINGHELEVHACNKLMELNVKYKEKFGKDIPIGGANRSFNTQNSIFDWPYYDKNGKGRKKGTNGGVAAAKPGTSQHGWGLAIDTSNLGDKGSPKFDWMDANAPKYGWVNPGWAKKGGAGHEPWHWEYIGGDAYKNDGAK